MGSCVSSSAKVDSTNTSTVASGFSKDTGCSKSSDQCYSKVEIGSSVKTEGEILSSPNVKSFSLSDLKSITRNFQYQVGEGGFGLVFKGWMDEQTLAPSKPGLGMVVAVKKLRSDSFQGHREWLTEVNYLGHFHHSNLVKLIGYCLDGDNRLLVYEFMAKGSLENHLFKRGSQPLPWETRIKIALGAARGLSFLHNPESQVIYRDVKSSNILLDADFNAKLSDFGLVKAGPSGDQTHVSTQIIGTQGYAAPEYIATGRLSARCDVYSFGVVLLELLTGRPALLKNKFGADDSLVEWAKPYVGDKRKLFRIMDIKLEGQYPKTEACVLASLASQCLNNDSKLRPQMTEVCSILEQIYNKKNTVQSASLHLHSPRSNPKSKSPINLTPVVSPLPSPHHQSSRER